MAWTYHRPHHGTMMLCCRVGGPSCVFAISWQWYCDWGSTTGRQQLLKWERGEVIWTGGSAPTDMSGVNGFHQRKWFVSELSPLWMSNMNQYYTYFAKEYGLQWRKYTDITAPANKHLDKYTVCKGKDRKWRFCEDIFTKNAYIVDLFLYFFCFSQPGSNSLEVISSFFLFQCLFHDSAAVIDGFNW